VHIISTAVHIVPCALRTLVGKQPAGGTHARLPVSAAGLQDAWMRCGEARACIEQCCVNRARFSGHDMMYDDVPVVLLLLLLL